MDRELYMCGSNEAKGPGLPLPLGCLVMIRKGVFGLADAPRQWYLRLDRCLREHGWIRSVLDGACWSLKDVNGNLIGMVVGHVDDLLNTGNEVAEKSLKEIGEELGFGTEDYDNFVWCGKRIRREPSDGTIRVSMVEYHENLKTAPVPRDRRKQLDDELTRFEKKLLKGILGSLQWLVAQLRLDEAFTLLSMQTDTAHPTVASLLRANAAVTKLQQNKNFELGTSHGPRLASWLFRTRHSAKPRRMAALT